MEHTNSTKCTQNSVEFSLTLKLEGGQSEAPERRPLPPSLPLKYSRVTSPGLLALLCHDLPAMYLNVRQLLLWLTDFVMKVCTERDQYRCFPLRYQHQWHTKHWWVFPWQQQFSPVHRVEGDEARPRQKLGVRQINTLRRPVSISVDKFHRYWLPLQNASRKKILPGLFSPTNLTNWQKAQQHVWDPMCVESISCNSFLCHCSPLFSATVLFPEERRRNHHDNHPEDDRHPHDIVKPTTIPTWQRRRWGHQFHTRPRLGTSSCFPLPTEETRIRTCCRSRNCRILLQILSYFLRIRYLERRDRKNSLRLYKP